MLGKSRSWYYYTPYKDPAREAKDAFDKHLLEETANRIPFYGYRKICLEIHDWYHMDISFKRTYRLWHKMGFHAIRVPLPTSTPRTAHKTFPYLLSGRQISKPNEAWQVDITYLQLPQGTVYLCALIDVYSRKILSWNISNTMDVFFVLWPLTWALEKYGPPEILNTDQGSQFTTEDWIGMVEDLNIRVSMNGKNRSLDNIYIERWWKTYKYEDFYLHQHSTVSALKKGIKEYIEFYNTRRFHQELEYKRPDEVYFKQDAGMTKAA